MNLDAAACWQFPNQELFGEDLTAPRVLMFDRDPLFCVVMERAAQQSGVVLVGVSSFESFSQLVSTQKFDAIVADSLPESLMQAVLGSGRAVVSKKGGPKAILDSVRSLKYFSHLSYFDE
jgi:hypothetical protein